jgi:hypothetical protein
VVVLSVAFAAGWTADGLLGAPGTAGAPAPPPPAAASDGARALDGPVAPRLRRVSSFAPAQLPPVVRTLMSSARGLRAARGGSGQLRTVPGTTAPSGPGPVQAYAVEIERGIGVSPARFAATVEETLARDRGWTTPRARAFRRVEGTGPAFRVTLASPRTTDRLCAPLSTNGRYSCFNAGRAVLNSRRWLRGAPAYRGRLADYRRYMVNHEVGHALGFGHAPCRRRGARAPVMLQQTKGVDGCRPNPWPLPSEDPGG